MKTMLLISICSVCFCFVGLNTTSVNNKKSTKTIRVSADSINFVSQVQPILQKNCSPCHFTGGKMYEKMPFDDPKTLLGHQSGILKRIKKDDENLVLKQFIEENMGQ
jgi:hypothetical protein